jgi:hypothetical protein
MNRRQSLTLIAGTVAAGALLRPGAALAQAPAPAPAAGHFKLPELGYPYCVRNLSYSCTIRESRPQLQRPLPLRERATQRFNDDEWVRGLVCNPSPDRVC